MKHFIAGVIAGIIIGMLCSCKQIEYVTVEKVRNDTTYITKHQRDSVWLHDSIRVSEEAYQGKVTLLEMQGE